MGEERPLVPGKQVRPGFKARGAWRRLGVLLLLAVTVWVGFNLLQVARMPTEIKEIVARQSLTGATSFSYQVYPNPSLLFPEAEPLAEGELFFTRVVRDIEVGFTTRLEPEPAIPLTGFYQVWLVCAAPGLWERSYLLQEETWFSTQTGQALEISGTYSLGLTERLAFIKGVEDEIGVNPRDGYQLLLRPEIHLTNDLPADATRDFKPQFGFSVKTYELKPLGEPKQEHKQNLLTEVSRPTHVSLFGSLVSVNTARYIFGAIFALCGSGLLAIFVQHLKRVASERKAFEGSYINHRYRSRIIRIHSIDGMPADRPLISMSSFAELLRIADEREKPIVLIQSKDNLFIRYTYYVLDEDNLYIYSTSEPLARSALAGGVT